MDKRYQPKTESAVYTLWEKAGAFTPKDTGEPFTVIMPPPNANGQLHIGHALFVGLEDIIIRYQRMRGKAALWLPGADHASIASQVSYEKVLAAKHQTRFDLGREKFFTECFAFTKENKKIMYGQLKHLGASCDWTREKFTLDPEISRQVQETFVRLHQDNLVKRAEKLINWCPRCMTVLSTLELEYFEEKTPLYFIKYGPLTLATVRPETKHGDTAVAVHPADPRYQKWIGKQIEIDDVLGKAILTVIADEAVDPEFGTGVIKVTPAHDPTDWEISQRHHLKIRRVIDFSGRLNENTGKYQGLTISEARKQIVTDLASKELIDKVDPNYRHRVGRCERCNAVIEPMVSLQWFITTQPLAQTALRAVKQGKIKIVPRRFAKIFYHWMTNILDWPVARQLWFGQQLPVWYCGTRTMSDLQKSMNQIGETEGCGEIVFSVDRPTGCPKCNNRQLIQDPDVFDTWFSSGQWPYTALGFRWNRQSQSPDFTRFYPTDVMETAHDILFFWVARMAMLGLYATKNIPFKTVYLHGLVRDAKGLKMSKSKGNVINPIPVIEEYGADALRMALVVGTSAGNDSSASYEKIKGYRNFANKVWNAARFVIESQKQSPRETALGSDQAHPEDQQITSELNRLIELVTTDFENYRYSQAGERLYYFFWHVFCDQYLESTKDRLANAGPTLIHVLTTTLRLLHPFMPFVTEGIWQELNNHQLLPDELQAQPLLINTAWPKT